MQWKKLLSFRQREDAWADTQQGEADTVLLATPADASGFAETRPVYEHWGSDTRGETTPH